MAKFLSRQRGEVDIKVSGVNAFSNEQFNGFEINWFNEKIGFGSCTILLSQDDEGNFTIKADSEAMCANDDKRFLKALFEEIIDQADVIG